MTKASSATSSAEAGSRVVPVAGADASVAAYLQRRRDNFLLLRVIAAVAVIYGHAFALAVPDGSRDVFLAHGFGLFSGDIAVNIFFIVSGFMVSGSFMARSSLGNYAKARLLRIVPAYIAVLVMCAFVIGPLLTSLPMGSYFADPATIEYVLKNLKFSSDMAWNLPGVFVGDQHASMNGSLWTLPAEMRMYALVAALGVFGCLRPTMFCTIAVVGLMAVGVFAPTLLPLHTSWLHLAGYFCLGILVQLNKDRLVVRHSTMLVLVFVTYISALTGSYMYLLAASIAYFCFWFAYLTPHWAWLERWGDPSYGVYLWGWPVQKMVMAAIPFAVPWQNFLVSAPIAIALGYASWHLVEKPALRLKDRPLVPAFARNAWLRLRRAGVPR